MYCTACNTKVMATLRMCPKCGNRQFSETPTASAAQKPVTVANSTSPTAASFATHPPASGQPVRNAASSLAGRGARLGAVMLDFVIFLLALHQALLSSMALVRHLHRFRRGSNNCRLVRVTNHSGHLPYKTWAVIRKDDRWHQNRKNIR